MTLERPYWPTGTVYGALLNFKAECAAMAPLMTQPPYKAPPQAPVLFIKTANTWSPSGAAVGLPPHVPQVEAGASIGMVIGALSAGNAGPSATPPLAGFVLMNDFSVPHTSFFRPPVKFKCIDGFLGVGDRLVSPEQVGDPAMFKLEVRINNDLRQTVDFSGVVRSAAKLLADVNEFMTLREGDVLMLGCDAGRPLAKTGDRIDISAPALPCFGTLFNTLIAEAG